MKWHHLFVKIAIISLIWIQCASYKNGAGTSNPKTIPLTVSLIEKYSLSASDLEKLNYFLPYQLVLKKGDSNLSFTIDDRGVLNLGDRRKDSMLVIKSNYIGKAKVDLVSHQTWQVWKKSKSSYRFTLNFFPGHEDKLVFMENEQGYYEVLKDERGRISFGGNRYACVSGCGNILMVLATEAHSYFGRSSH